MQIFHLHWTMGCVELSRLGGKRELYVANAGGRLPQGVGLPLEATHHPRFSCFFFEFDFSKDINSVPVIFAKSD